MFNEISDHIKTVITNFSEEDSIIFNNKIYPINKENFQTIIQLQGKSLAFIDGGQAEILKAGNFCLSFIRVCAAVFQNNQKKKNYQKEFYLFTRARWINEDIYYESKIFGGRIIAEEDLLISSNDASIKIGTERAPITKVANMARRFAELSLAKEVEADVIIMDGTLEPTFKNEEKYLSLGNNVGALAKSSSLFTVSGNSPIVLLNKKGLEGCWRYCLNEKTNFVKLHPRAKYVFRFEGNKDALPFLISNCDDALFLGYPYGLILADKIARVSNAEKSSLTMRFLLSSNNKEIRDYLHTTNAHDLLDQLG